MEGLIQYLPTLEQQAGGYQVLEDVGVGGVTAPFLASASSVWTDEDGNTVTEQMTGFLL